MNASAGSPPPIATASIAALKKKAGWCAILLGGLGIHKFILGYNRAGTTMLVIALVGWIFFAVPLLVISLIALIEGVIYLRKSDADFAATYVQGRREWF